MELFMRDINFIIIVPVYNAVKFLERAVASVISQKYDRRQLVLVDDGSTDGSSKLCERLSQENDSVHMIRQKNMGQISARANGIRYARIHLETEDTFYLFLDADDAFAPDAMERISQLISEKDCDLLVFGIEQQDAAGKTDRSMLGTFEGTVESRAELYRIVLFDYRYNSLCRKAVSASLIPDKDYADLYDFRHGEDLLQSYDYYKSSKKAVFTREIFYIYYTNEASVTNSLSADSFQYGSQVRSAIWDAVAAENVWTENDLKKYSEYNCRLLRNKIMALCVTDASIKEIVPVLECMKEDSFYQRIVAENNSYDRIIKLFYQGKYRELIRYIRLRVRMIRLLGK